MNVFTAVMLVFAALGLLDKIRNGRWGLAAAFDSGLAIMGPMLLTMSGLYCIGVTVVQNNAETLGRLSAVIPFDPAIFMGCLLAPDMGGYPIAVRMAADPLLGIFFGVLVSSTLGTVVGCQLPIFLGTISEELSVPMLRGLVIGVGTLPVALLLGGLLLGVPATALLVNMAPVALLCFALIIALLRAGKLTTLLLQKFGAFVRGLSFVLFALVIVDLYFPGLGMIDPELRNEVFTLMVRVLAIICGAMVFSHIMTTKCRRPLLWAAEKLGINEYAVLGLLLGFTTSLAMLPLFGKMDYRGKILNGAFSAVGPYVLGGQMAFISGVADTSVLSVYFATKFLGIVLAIGAAMLVTKLQPESA